jgi:hypothetical protein
VRASGSAILKMRQLGDADYAKTDTVQLGAKIIEMRQSFCPAKNGGNASQTWHDRVIAHWR